MNKTESMLITCLNKALDAVKAEKSLPPLIEKLGQHPAHGRTVVLSVGKAAYSMALTFDSHYQLPFDGICISHYDDSEKQASLANFIHYVATHPVPGTAGLEAAEKVIETAKSLTKDDHLILLLSGGASALMPAPKAGVSLDDKIWMTKQLLACGAPIQDINCVRQHLSQLKGGGLLALAAPAQVITLAVSDVVGDDPVYIASGPTVPCPTSAADAMKIIQTYSLNAPDSVLNCLKQSDQSISNSAPASDTLKSEYIMAASGKIALDAVKQYLDTVDIPTHSIGDEETGNAQTVAKQHAMQIIEMLDQITERPLAFVSGGELTVELCENPGRGGPNSEYILALYAALEDMAPDLSWAAAAMDTDGGDGMGGHAGAIISSDTVKKMRASSLNPTDYLQSNNSYDYFKEFDALYITGPTDTNVNDIRIIIVE